MWDLIILVPDHCLSFYFVKNNRVVLADKWDLGLKMCIITESPVVRLAVSSLTR